MSQARNIADLVDANGDIVAGALDNVPAADLVNDTTPQLGGNLDLNSNNITGTGNVDADIFKVGGTKTKPMFQILAIDSSTATVINNTSWNAITGTAQQLTITKPNTLRQYSVMIPGEIDSNAGNVFAKVYRSVNGGSYSAFSNVTNLNFPANVGNGTVNSTVQVIDTTSYAAGTTVAYRIYVKVQNSNSNLELGQNNLSGNSGLNNHIQGFLSEYDHS